MKHAMTSNLEDYLEAILHVARENGEAHASAVADYVGVTRASVTGALRSLADRGLIDYQPYQPVTLTEEGRRVAQACTDRHQFLHQFFRDQLGMADDEADAVACRVEHVASPTVLSRLAEFSRFLSDCQEVDLTWTDDGTLLCTRDAGCSGCERSRPAVSE